MVSSWQAIRRHPLGILSAQFRLGDFPCGIVARGQIIDASLTKTLGFDERPKRAILVGMNSRYPGAMAFASHRLHEPPIGLIGWVARQLQGSHQQSVDLP